jgi:mono/diheme cytochrome c family protein
MLLRRSSTNPIEVFGRFHQILRDLAHFLPPGACLSSQELESRPSAQPQALHQNASGHADPAVLLQCNGELRLALPQAVQLIGTRHRGSRVIAYRLGSAPTVMNDATGQVALADVPKGSGNDSAAAASPSTGSAPYTMQQVARGSEVYAKACANCHGGNLQGLSAPALTGPGFGHSHLNASQLRGVVTQSMPLTAPGSLPAADYAAVMAFMLNYDCVPPAGNSQPFPTTGIPALQQVTLGGTTCAPETSAPTARR